MGEDGNKPWEWKGAGTSHGAGGLPQAGVRWGGGIQDGADAALSQLLEMKSTDRKQTLLHYLVRVITEKYPELTGFHTELHFLDKAGSGSTRGHRPGDHGRLQPPRGDSQGLP